MSAAAPAAAGRASRRRPHDSSTRMKFSAHTTILSTHWHAKFGLFSELLTRHPMSPNQLLAAALEMLNLAPPRPARAVFYVHAPDYTYMSSGIRCLHLLCSVVLAEGTCNDANSLRFSAARRLFGRSAYAQQTERMRRIGVLSGYGRPPREATKKGRRKRTYSTTAFFLTERD